MSFKVLPDDLFGHAGSLDELKEKIARVAGQGEPAIGGQTFGFIGEFFATGAIQQAQQTNSAISTTSDAAGKLSEAVRACADDYGATDQANSDEIGKAGSA